MTVTMTFAVERSCDAACFDMPEWRGLLEGDVHGHVFASPEWNRVWWEEFGADKELFLLTMRRGDEVAAIVPLFRKRRDDRLVLRFIGGVSLTDYLGPVCRLEDREEVAEALVGYLADADFEWDELDAHCLPVPFGFTEFLVDRADRRGFDVVLEQEETAAVLPLARDWESYLARLHSKDRHELRRKRRRLWRDHPEAQVRTTTAETLDGDLKIFFEMHRGAQGHKGHFMRPEIATFFERVAHAFLPLGWLRLDWLEVGGRPLAATFGFERGDTFYLYNSAYEEDASRLSPGLVLASELVSRSIENGLSTFDFLRGPERYKYVLGAQTVPLNNVRVLNTRLA